MARGMLFGDLVRRRLISALGPLLGALLIAYFLYHAVEGDRGLLAYLRLKQEINKAEITASLIHADKELIERRVKLLRPGGLDLDMLDERAHAMLNLQKRDELTILLQRGSPAP